MLELGCAGCLLYLLIGFAAAVPVAIIVLIAQGGAKRKAWRILGGQDTSEGEVRQLIGRLNTIQHDAEAQELIRRLTDLLMDDGAWD